MLATGGEQRMKIRIKRNANPRFGSRVLQDVCISSPSHADFRDMNHVPPTLPQQGRGGPG